MNESFAIKTYCYLLFQESMKRLPPHDGNFNLRFGMQDGYLQCIADLQGSEHICDDWVAVLMDMMKHEKMKEWARKLHFMHDYQVDRESLRNDVNDVVVSFLENYEIHSREYKDLISTLCYQTLQTKN